MHAGVWSTGWPAPAKVNLFLHVTGRRADGLHELQTLFQFLDHADVLAFRVRADGTVSRRFGNETVDPEHDLCLRAARRLRQETGVGLGADLAITKRVPLGGGLGGGSSDAATTLLALNHLWGTGLEPEALSALALGLGADVPVFVAGHAAWAEGVGERLTPVDPREPWYLVVVPPVAVSTADVFGDPQLTRNSPPIKIADFLSRGGGNDCEPVVRRRFPEVGSALDWLAAQGATPRMSGTGACVFGAFPDESRARRARARLPSSWRGFVARGCNRSPLAVRMERLSGG